MPVPTGVRGVVELVAVSNEVGAIVRVFVVVEGEDSLFREKLGPGIAFVL